MSLSLYSSIGLAIIHLRSDLIDEFDANDEFKAFAQIHEDYPHLQMDRRFSPTASLWDRVDDEIIRSVYLGNVCSNSAKAYYE